MTTMRTSQADEPRARAAAGWTAATVAGFAVIATTIALVDMFEVIDVGDALNGSMWRLVYRDSAVLDFVSWGVLATGMLLASNLAGRLRGAGEARLAAFWTLMAVALLLMLIDDAGQPIHFLGTVGIQTFGIPPTVTRIALAAGLAAVPAYAVVRHGRHVWAFAPARAYLVASFAVYAVGVAMTTVLWRWYGPLGARLDLWVFRHRLPRDQTLGVIHEVELMDVLVRPSVELLAAALFVALALAFRRHPAVRGDPDFSTPTASRPPASSPPPT